MNNKKEHKSSVYLTIIAIVLLVTCVVLASLLIGFRNSNKVYEDAFGYAVSELELCTAEFNLLIFPNLTREEVYENIIKINLRERILNEVRNETETNK